MLVFLCEETSNMLTVKPEDTAGKMVQLASAVEQGLQMVCCLEPHRQPVLLLRRLPR